MSDCSGRPWAVASEEEGGGARQRRQAREKKKKMKRHQCGHSRALSPQELNRAMRQLSSQSVDSVASLFPLRPAAVAAADSSKEQRTLSFFAPTLEPLSCRSPAAGLNTALPFSRQSWLACTRSPRSPETRSSSSSST